VAKSRGVDKTVCTSIMDYSAEKFETLLLLMNGLGIAMTLKGVYPLLIHLKSLMNPKAQILLDSSNLIYLFDEEDQESWLNDERYYGEVDYGISYKGRTEEFPWLYLDYENLNELAQLAGFDCKKIMDGENEDYLARLTSMES
ncbi:SAM-dependent methyltransferase, partial [Flavobacteriaceae bacterium]|nr:SAM-dependent methyltransferase [Flavobacteriaceae bacterium]